MAIKASVTITISCYRDTQSITRYYKLQASTAAVPTKPTKNPPTGWTDTEPSYTSGSTNTLYFCDLTVFSNGEWSCSNVSVSSSYEAAKAAYNKANAAQDAVEKVEEKLDGKADIWFYEGTPTVTNYPANTWEEDGFDIHVGDMYYDRLTGYAYEFRLTDGQYIWGPIKDKDTIEALALANSAKDTADNKRRVFTSQPYPPYDNGDLWVRNMEIYICQISKAETEEYAENDFIVATKYTDDTLANQVGDRLEVLRGTVTTIEKNADSVRIELETTTKTINELQEEVVESSEKIKYQIDTEDFSVSKSGSEMSTHISEDGMRVKKNTNDVLVANSSGVEATNLHAKTYLIVGNNSRFEDYNTNRTGCFWIGN